MLNKAIQALVSVSLLLTGNTLFADEVASPNAASEQPANQVSSSQIEDLFAEHQKIKKQLMELLENDPELSPKRELIEGGFEFHTPKAYHYKGLMVLNSLDVTTGLFAGGIIGTIFKMCDNSYTKVDDWIRWIATVDGANYLTSGLGLDFVTFGDKVNYAVASVEIGLGAVLLKRWVSNQGAGGKGEAAAGPGTRLCSPMTALTSMGLGGLRIYDSVESAGGMKQFFSDSVAPAVKSGLTSLKDFLSSKDQ